MALILAATNILLLRQNIQMRRGIDNSGPPLLKTGEKVPPFRGLDLEGQPVAIAYTGKESVRVLLYFTPACPYCHDQFPYWRQVAERAPSPRFEVIGLVSDKEDRAGVATYLRSVGCEQLPVAFVPGDVIIAHKLSMTPTTLVVGNDGRVERVWPGKWDSSALTSASSLFGAQISDP
jgi:hypothetical protein